jgi:hypothetical protein
MRKHHRGMQTLRCMLHFIYLGSQHSKVKRLKHLLLLHSARLITENV